MPEFVIKLVDAAAAGQSPKTAAGAIAGANTPSVSSAAAALTATGKSSDAAGAIPVYLISDQMTALLAAIGGGGGGGGAGGSMGGAAPTSASPSAGGSSFAGNVKSVGSTLESVASNDSAGTVQAGASGVASLVGSFGAIGAVVGAAVAGFAVLALATAELVNTFVERGKQLQQYSPELSQANQVAEMRSMFADMREAQELGPALAELTDAQSRLDATFRELMLPIKKFIVEVLAGYIDYLSGVLKGFIGTLDAIAVTLVDVGEAIVQAVTLHGEKAAKALERIPQDVADAYTKAMNAGKDEDAWDNLIFKQLNALNQNQANFLAHPIAPLNGNLNIPAFNGL